MVKTGLLHFCRVLHCGTPCMLRTEFFFTNRHKVMAHEGTG